MKSNSKNLDQNGIKGYLTLALKNSRAPNTMDGFTNIAIIKSLEDINTLIKTHLARFLHYRHEGREPQYDSYTKVTAKMRAIVGRMKETERVHAQCGQAITPAESKIILMLAELLEELQMQFEDPDERGFAGQLLNFFSNNYIKLTQCNFKKKYF